MRKVAAAILVLLSLSACKGGIFDGGKIIPAGVAEVSQFSVVAQD